MIAYKVVRVKDKPRWWEFWKRPKRVSAIVGGLARVEYRIGKATKAPLWLSLHDYHLTAFDSLQDAGNFFVSVVRHYPELSFELWECAISDKSGPWTKSMMDSIGLECGGMIPVPSRTWFCSTTPTSARWPLGTVMAKQIKLLKRVA